MTNQLNIPKCKSTITEDCLNKLKAMIYLRNHLIGFFNNEITLQDKIKILLKKIGMSTDDINKKYLNANKQNIIDFCNFSIEHYYKKMLRVCNGESKSIHKLPCINVCERKPFHSQNIICDLIDDNGNIYKMIQCDPTSSLNMKEKIKLTKLHRLNEIKSNL